MTLVVGLLLAGCGDDEPADEPAGTSATAHNDADVAFAGEMIQHHAQALAMVDLTVGRELDPEIQAIAESIRAAQGPEIETMTDWLTEWDEPIPATVRDHLNAEGHGDHGDDTGMDMPGMMSADEMAALGAASDAEFGDLFVTMMIEHHEGAVEMAQAEQEDGRYEPAVTLAEQIESGQAAEIETMQMLAH